MNLFGLSLVAALVEVYSYSGDSSSLKGYPPASGWQTLLKVAMVRDDLHIVGMDHETRCYNVSPVHPSHTIPIAVSNMSLIFPVSITICDLFKFRFSNSTWSRILGRFTRSILILKISQLIFYWRIVAVSGNFIFLCLWLYGLIFVYYHRVNET